MLQCLIDIPYRKIQNEQKVLGISQPAVNGAEDELSLSPDPLISLIPLISREQNGGA